jgi:integrase
LQSLTTLHVKALYQQLAKTGLVRERKEKDGSTTHTEGPLSRKSIHNTHICLRAALNEAVEDRLLRVNPAAKAHSYSRTKHRPEMVVWSVEEIRAFLQSVADQRESTLYRAALSTGMRRGELLGLRRRDLQLDAGRLPVRQQWCWDGANGRRFKGLKTGSQVWRTIELDPGTVFLLKRQLQDQELERGQWGGSYQDHDLVFCHPDGRPLDPTWTTKRFEKLSAVCSGAKAIRFHDLRQTHATMLLEEGTKYVAERLGDREDTVTETYAHVTSKSRRRAVETV